MSAYHLHARLHEGPLGRPVRNELQMHNTDDLAEVELTAKALASDGFTVWIYDHGHGDVCAGASDYRLILLFTPDGQRVDYR
ncbi:hypothetical protein [Pseudonocardia spinosispora]|uniref:hypothetical protein n=1 Tax=Pseudonocardia spinosispora TaxID=103441 RepID=UPI00146FB961|nr:hypothetical protein [Pseudonocardia spinosispora]